MTDLVDRMIEEAWREKIRKAHAQPRANNGKAPKDLTKWLHEEMKQEYPREAA